MPDAGTHPLPCVQRMVGSTHASRDRYAEHAGIPCAMVYGLYVLSPVSGLVSHRRDCETSRKRLTSASGGRDHTISLVRLRLQSSLASQKRPSQPRLTFRDDWP
jgi:hypothetical protein